MNANLNELRPRMMSVAYRMLGSVADAEDAVQDAFLRLQVAGEVLSPEGFLVKTTTRRCIDKLRADRRRKQYVGPWVPEPVDTKQGRLNTVLSESLTQAFLLMLERLSPEERAAFLLRTVFDYKYAEIAEILGKSEVHVRQIVSRAKSRLERDKLRFQPSPREAEGLAERFLTACQLGDMSIVEKLFAEEAEIHSDGGGKVSAARVVVRGRNRAARFLVGLFRKRQRDSQMRNVTVNGEPGVVFISDGAVIQVVSLCIRDEVQAVFMTNNPDKLSRWSLAAID
ncbi:RNA polymerase sigma factor SigJ [Blastopirellula sp. J2-11]|uniref:RNA polymerase sigma factor SigJ n=1 Tax=Blastopirellula sp. J2-11 TaxID=2943192 RepID=UPI0021C59723|nr:RNA polymerase sigma factor SigJ [Blastopirellula sp. J2-11]UUO05735.1 RNA polymerase sigma factor SigJ [Blastopirellula sp. J2-11]